MLGLRQRTIACPQCGRDTDGRARWCGSCGAILTVAPGLDARPPAEDVREPAAAGDERPRSGRLRAVGGVVVVVTVLAAAAVVLRPAPVATSLLGRLDTGDGPSATHPPAAGLAVAWRQPVDTAGDEPWFLGGDGDLVVRDGRAAIGGVVVDLDSGGLVADLRAAPLHGTWGVTGEAAMLRGATLHVVDVPTGAVVARADVDTAALPAEGGSVEVVAAARGRGTSLFGVWGPPDDQDPYGIGRWVLVADDGRVVAAGVGSPYGWGPERADSTTHAVVVAPPDVIDPEGHWGPEEWLVLDLRTGEEVLRVSAGEDADWPIPPRVVGQHALEVRPVAGDGPGSVGTWQVTLHDLVARVRVWQAQVVSDEPPVLHAVIPGGQGAGDREGAGGVVATRSGSELATLHVDASGVREVARVPLGGNHAVYNGPPTAALVTVDDDLVVMVDLEAEALVATNIDGSRVWRDPLPPIAAESMVQLEAADGLVAVLVDDGHAARLHVAHRDDGSAAGRASIGRQPHPGMPRAEAAAVVDGLVAVASRADPYWGAPLPTLGSVDWFDVRDGRERALQEVAAGWLRGIDVPAERRDDDGTLDTSLFLRARLSGTVLGQDGRVRPVVLWPEHGGVLRLLVDGGSPQDVDLRLDEQRGRDGIGTELRSPHHLQGEQDVVAVTDAQLVLRSIDHDGRQVTVAVDRELGEVQVVQDVWPLGVTQDVVVGRQDAEGRVSLVGHDLDDGRRLWEVPWSWSDTIAVGEQVVVVLTATEVVARAPGSGDVVWRASLDAPAAGAPVLTERSVLVRTAYGEVLALDREDGAVRWRRQVDAVVSALGAAGEHALLGTHDGAVVELDDRGRQVQRVEVGASPVAGVESAGTGLVAITGDQVVGLQPQGTGIARQDEVPLP